MNRSGASGPSRTDRHGTVESTTDQGGKAFNLAVLMGWLTACAIYLAIARGWLDQGPQTWLQLTQLTVVTVLTASGWIGLVVVANRLAHGQTRSIDPGLWLLFSLGIVVTTDLVAAMLPDSFPLPDHIVRITINTLAFSLPLLSRRLPFSWKPMFMLLSLLNLVRIVDYPPISIPRVSGSSIYLAVVAIILIVLRSVDFSTRRRRPSALHWVGVACTVTWLVLLYVS